MVTVLPLMAVTTATSCCPRHGLLVFAVSSVAHVVLASQTKNWPLSLVFPLQPVPVNPVSHWSNTIGLPTARAVVLSSVMLVAPCEYPAVQFAEPWYPGVQVPVHGMVLVEQ